MSYLDRRPGLINDYVFKWNVSKIFENKISPENGTKIVKFFNPQNRGRIWKVRLKCKESSPFISVWLIAGSAYPPTTKVFFNISLLLSPRVMLHKKKGRLSGRHFMCINFISKEEFSSLLQSEENLFIRIQIKEFALENGHNSLFDLSLPYEREENGRLYKNINIFMNNFEPDVSLRVSQSTIKVHKCILIEHSPVFANILKQNPSSSILVENFKKSIVESMIHFIYFNKPKEISVDTACELYAAARFYQIYDLMNLCMEFMKNNIDKDSVCNLYESARLYHIEGIVKLCLNYFKGNLTMSTLWYVLRMALRENEEELKSLTIQFICNQRRKFFKLAEWKAFLHEYPSYALKVLQAYIEK